MYVSAGYFVVKSKVISPPALDNTLQHCHNKATNARSSVNCCCRAPPTMKIFTNKNSRWVRGNAVITGFVFLNRGGEITSTAGCTYVLCTMCAHSTLCSRLTVIFF